MDMKKALDILDHYISCVGESPLWDYRSKELLYIDIRGKSLHSCDWLSGKHSSLPLPQQAGCIALTNDDTLIAAMEEGIYYLDRKGRYELAHPRTPIAGPRFNDGKVGPDGRFYVGTIKREGGGEFYRLEKGKALQSVFGDVKVSNGLDWSPDFKTLYYCDTGFHRIDAFDFDVENGSLRNRRTILVITEAMGSPDGMTIDTEGNLWIALWNGGAVIKVDPRIGEIIERVALPASKVSCCAFAGENLEELVITTASLNADPTEEPSAG